MPLYELTPNTFRPIDQSSFAELKVRERYDLQRLLRSQIDVLGEGLYVLAEEFGDWEESRRRIDLLAIDKQANLVVIELKRTNDGGHMELQAIRYASMVSSMTFERAEQIHGVYLCGIGTPADEARRRILNFLEWEEPDEENFATEVRIILGSEDFGKELTTAVLWLRDRDINIQCIRLRPYKDGKRCLIDVQQIIPLPEANDYIVSLREKEHVTRKSRAQHSEVNRSFWEGLLAIVRSRNMRHANISPGPSDRISASSGITGLRFNYIIKKGSGDVELYIDRNDAKENKRIFDYLSARKDEIETAFGAPLRWWRLDGCRASVIRSGTERGGYRSPEAQWPDIQGEMVERMSKLEAALNPVLTSLGSV